MSRFLDMLNYRRPVLDYGWRVALYPAGTALADALAHEEVVQGELGNTIDPATAMVLSSYYVRGTADYLPDDADRNDGDHGWRDVVTQTGTVPVRYRVSGPRIHP